MLHPFFKKDTPPFSQRKCPRPFNKRPWPEYITTKSLSESIVCAKGYYAFCFYLLLQYKSVTIQSICMLQFNPGSSLPHQLQQIFDFKYDLTMKIQSPKNHWTLEWRGLNLYSRGHWFDGERLARKSWSSLPPIGCNRSHWHLTARYPKYPKIATFFERKLKSHENLFPRASSLGLRS